MEVYAGANVNEPIDLIGIRFRLDRIARIKTLKEVERDTIFAALFACDWDVQLVAFFLKVDDQTIYNRLAEYGISTLKHKRSACG